MFCRITLDRTLTTVSAFVLIIRSPVRRIRADGIGDERCCQNACRVAQQLLFFFNCYYYYYSCYRVSLLEKGAKRTLRYSVFVLFYPRRKRFVRTRKPFHKTRCRSTHALCCYGTIISSLRCDTRVREAKFIL